MVATRAVDGGCGAGYGDPPFARVGVRPGSVTDPRPQVRVQRHTVDQMVDAPLLPTFDVPVPLMVEQLLLGVLSPLGVRVAEKVIEVPKILLDVVPERAAVRVTQLAEQLLEVPKPVSCMEQIVDIPTSVRGVSGSLQGFPPEQSSAKRTALQVADISVPGRGGSGCLLGFPSEQSTTAPHVSPERISERIVEQIGAGGDFPSRRAGPRVVLPRQGSAAAGAEQLADIVSSGGPHGFLPGQVSTASPGPVHVDEHLPDSAEWVQLRDEATSKPYFWNRRSEAAAGHPSRLGRREGLWRRSGTGTRVPVSVHTTSLLCLLSEAHRSEGLGIPSHPSRMPPLADGVCELPETYTLAPGLVASVSCVLLARQWIQYIRLSSVLLVAISDILV